MKPVLPSPEKLQGTRSCELAALIATLGFTPADRQMAVVTGDAVPGGKLGYWRFLDLHPAAAFKLRHVIARGLDPAQAAAPSTPALPVYPEQAYIAAAFHNARLLAESVRLGTPLSLRPCGFLFLFQRSATATPVPELPGPATAASLLSAGTRRTELAAALATLGFTPTPVRSVPAAAPGVAISHEQSLVTWMLPPVSLDLRWQLPERLARWADDAWCSRPSNTDPIAVMADAFWNLRHLRRSLQSAARLVSIQARGRSVLISANASQKTWDKVSQFLS